MPWEQLNNQLIEFKSACAMAAMLNRILVVPKLGYRALVNTNDPNVYRSYKPVEFIWNNFDRYFDSSHLLRLPCKTISIENFQNLNRGASVGIINYIDLGEGATTQNQIKEYYEHTVRIPFDGIACRNVYYQLSRDDIIQEYGNDESSRVLALGSLFWHYDFGIKQQYPISKYYEYLEAPADPIYKKISSSLVFGERITTIGNLILSKITEPMIAAHVRRGDYGSKCNESWHRESCFVTDEYLESSLKTFNQSMVFISTNDETMNTTSLAGKGMVFLRDLLGESEDLNYTPQLNLEQLAEDDSKPPSAPSLRMDLDPIDFALLDQYICIYGAVEFIGNIHSSFSRHIVEQRALKGRKSHFFSSISTSSTRH